MGVTFVGMALASKASYGHAHKGHAHKATPTTHNFETPEGQFSIMDAKIHWNHAKTWKFKTLFSWMMRKFTFRLLAHWYTLQNPLKTSIYDEFCDRETFESDKSWGLYESPP